MTGPESIRIEIFLFVILNSDCIDMYEACIYINLALKNLTYGSVLCMVELKLFLHFLAVEIF